MWILKRMVMAPTSQLPNYKLVKMESNLEPTTQCAAKQSGAAQYNTQSKATSNITTNSGLKTWLQLYPTFKVPRTIDRLLYTRLIRVNQHLD